MNKQRTIILLLGILTGLFVIGSSSFYYEIKSKLYQIEAAGVDSKNCEQEKVVVSTYDAVSNVVSVNLNLPVLLSFGEINLEKEENSSSSATEVKENLVPFLKTLFRKIISPNAP